MFVTSKKMTAAVLAITLAMSLSACSNWSKRDRNTAIGAGAGALGGCSTDRWQYVGYIRWCSCRWCYWSPGR
ncbi:osmotically inducible lipoprotein B [Escherichia coli]|uniref:Osmotically inducible lipoprotein B n=1 Tax=Escherichia coli TaxID=562 RepID=A0A376THR9_ECOLX|nr:osmotically inducible lipoprotein B [Escherichia coli]